jgi:hypothetical protein
MEPKQPACGAGRCDGRTCVVHAHAHAGAQPRACACRHRRVQKQANARAEGVFNRLQKTEVPPEI